ncbi:MAG: hypothetical protein C0462_01605 [Alcanivorax sp.]|nr:hypothetical protein [Alcanivorax sp.]
MKTFKKLALVSAIAALPMTGFAMQQMDDEALSGVTGQDGISITLDMDANLDVWIEDTDGVADNAPLWTGLDNAGFLVIQNIAIDGIVNIDLDSGSAAGTSGAGGVLNVAISIPSLTIGDASNPLAIGVTGSDAAANDRDYQDGLGRVATAAAGTVTNVITLSSIELENLGLNIQLGPDAEQFLHITGDAFDMVIEDFTVSDASAAGGGDFYVQTMAITNIDLDGTVASITEDGLALTLGTPAAGMDIAMMGVRLGDNTAATLGNVYVTGLNLGGTTVTVTGR